MIIVRLKGGLGNQLFQYAFGYILAKKNNQKLLIDKDWFETEGNVPWLTKRSYELDKFKIPYATVTRHKDEKIIPRILSSRVVRRGFALFKKDQIRFDGWLIVSTTCACDYLNLPKSKNTMLNGYFDNHATVYLRGYLDDIRSEFEVKNISQSAQELINNIKRDQYTTAIHVRRTDQMHSTGHKADSEYYDKAMQYILDKQPDMKFYVFSDDIEWCKKRFCDYKNIVYATDPDDRDSMRDFLGMANCQNNIIAYSTYSWWAAMLNKNPGKIVITPEFYDSIEFLPDEWVVIK